MQAKFPGRCTYCSEPITVGVDTYDVSSRKNWHECCRINQQPNVNAYDLAARLGFVSWEQSQMKQWTKDNVVQMDLFRKAQ